MSRLSSRTSRSGILTQFLAQRALLIFLFVLSIALMIVGRINPGFNDRVQQQVIDIATPVADTLQAPLRWVSALREGVDNLVSTTEELQAIREENKVLKQFKPYAEQLAAENARLRSLLRLGKITNIPAVTARAVTHPGSPFLWTILLDTGARQNIQPYQPVIDHEGVVGRILSVGRWSSRALLVSDMNSRVPVLIEETSDRAILEGDNTRKPKLSFLDVAHKVKPGQRVMTSGDAGIFPPYLPVGTVVMEESGQLRVELASDLSRLEYVRVLAFEAPVSPEQEAFSGDASGEDANTAATQAGTGQ